MNLRIARISMASHAERRTSRIPRENPKPNLQIVNPGLVAERPAAPGRQAIRSESGPKSRGRPEGRPRRIVPPNDGVQRKPEVPLYVLTSLMELTRVASREKRRGESTSALAESDMTRPTGVSQRSCDVEPSNGTAADGVQREPEVPLYVLTSLMELTRVELATSGLQSRRSPS